MRRACAYDRALGVCGHEHCRARVGEDGGGVEGGHGWFSLLRGGRGVLWAGLRVGLGVGDGKVRFHSGSPRALEDWVSDRGPFRLGLVGWHGRAVGGAMGGLVRDRVQRRRIKGGF